MPDNTDHDLLQIAKDAALAAGEAIMRLYDVGDFESYQKADESPVTSADYKANEIITDILTRMSPDIPILSEETKHASLEERKTWQRYWLIDPIDGTQEFIARSGDFAVNIALIEDNKPKIGVIFWPPGQSLYYALAGHGAYKDSPEASGPISVRKLDDPHNSVVILAISRRQPRERVISKLCAKRVYQTLPLGSCSLKSCFIAEGKADVFMRLGVTGEWDTGASQCIVSEAGGAIYAADFEPLSYNQRNTLENPDFIVLGDQNVPWRDIIQYQGVSVFMLKQSLVLLSSLLIAPAFADWTVAPEQSSLHFMSTKNAQVTEVHAFEELEGSVSDSGKLMIEVPLSSVNTNIPIRNTRMQEKLFNVAKFPAATFTADVPADLMKLKAGSATTAKVDGTLSLHGVEAPVSFNVSVSKVSADTMVVSTVSPTLIGAETFGLTAGLDMLQNIAGLKSITQTSPVTFSVTFEME